MVISGWTSLNRYRLKIWGKTLFISRMAKLRPMHRWLPPPNYEKYQHFTQIDIVQAEIAVD